MKSLYTLISGSKGTFIQYNEKNRKSLLRRRKTKLKPKVKQQTKAEGDASYYVTVKSMRM